MAVPGCAKAFDKTDIVKIVDFELSPDEEKIAFAAVTPAGNTDTWVVDINGTNLKKLTFKDRSPTNNLARFFKKRKWRGFYEIDVHSPLWTSDGRVFFCEEITSHHATGIKTVDLIQWTIKPDGTKKREKTDKDKVVRRKPFDPINRPIISDQSEKHKKKIFLKDGVLWVLNYDETSPRKLVQ